MPIFLDIQSYISTKISDFWSVDFLGNISNNRYTFIPNARETTFGNPSEQFKMEIDFDGQEKDMYTSGMFALSLIYAPNSETKHIFSGSLFGTQEYEKYDIRSNYRLSEMVDPKSENREDTTILALGLFLEHARNSLTSQVQYYSYSGKYIKEKFSMQWGTEYKKESINTIIKEWVYEDSAGYNFPYNDEAVNVSNVIDNIIDIANNQITGFVQSTYRITSDAGKTLSLTGGLRAYYNELTSEFNVSPRIRIAYFPQRKSKAVYRFLPVHTTNHHTIKSL
ncbi:MAG: hypothetical protein IPO21_17645 [Bacteroidales bacterium]|nr:hypothetical protein [Bacteroidales bacterium]